MRWLGVIVVGALIIAGVHLLAAQSYSSLTSDEYYSLERWYFPLFPATYLTGLLILAVFPIQAMLRWRKQMLVSSSTP